MPTVRDVTFDLLRRLGLTTVVGNPGSTEETFLKNFPDDFTYILALQESSVVGVADGLAQGLGKPVLVNVHTGAGMGNAMGCILTAYLNKTPLIITAGQQTRDMLLGEPFLTNIDETLLPRPWVKWSYEPKRPQDVPGAFMRAYAMAMQQPQGPVFLSLPLDDWEKDMEAVDVLRTVSVRHAPDPARIADFAARINASANPVLVYGADLSRSLAWEQGVALAEAIQAPVWLGPFTERVPFPHDHPLYAGVLPPAVGPLSKALAGHDLVVVVGAPVFRYYPWVAGETLPAGAKLLQIIDDPYEAGKAVVGDSLVSDSGLAVEALLPLVAKRPTRGPVRPAVAQVTVADDAPLPLTPKQIFSVLSEVLTGGDCILVNESPSNMADLAATPLGVVTQPDSSFVMASGGLGWGMPAAVGLALAEKASGRSKPVVAVIGDGSFQYSLQSIWTGVQHGAHVVYVVLRNEEYGILKSFARLEATPGVPGLDLPGLDIVSLGKGYGAATAKVDAPAAIREAFAAALAFKGVSVIEIAADKHVGDLIPK
ncbi:MAG: thiamine pyrophosphate-dependent enzyme, possible carboligase or decarboxylase [Solidesulfovibrio magneticus str. Maddingley MBC34]|uniref:Thiamine pyrophosphate-dependent enzyme, possible carboligase or decarboxylase n=1 Tax=Solidesulfovibrio magneticus str. Maddingley MBC34 TaxID=1206767 RepID=K6H638_9BACT|nr:MAG: thiamine pyrophosphate-dependent enzyme, possible carboligase or decarboxylase [Solidesulfovibrio magneticus str. Maddingley MBC34]